ncbi:MAG: hypothetical protein KAU62_03935 [Candidatus Heimdallarchaeota archaeon]|nr:hypothetical protein [Candidatus Heimdallarchaeota archaeon]MCK4610287.1 hypothetical protein [Candidatus Heimdallarchaeota archaeon]
MKISKCPKCNEELRKHSHQEKAYYCPKRHEYISARLCKSCNEWIDIKED